MRMHLLRLLCLLLCAAFLKNKSSPVKQHKLKNERAQRFGYCRSVLSHYFLPPCIDLIFNVKKADRCPFSKRIKRSLYIYYIKREARCQGNFKKSLYFYATFCRFYAFLR